jgi:hypothetical protein
LKSFHQSVFVDLVLSFENLNGRSIKTFHPIEVIKKRGQFKRPILFVVIPVKKHGYHVLSQYFQSTKIVHKADFEVANVDKLVFDEKRLAPLV